MLAGREAGVPVAMVSGVGSPLVTGRREGMAGPARRAPGFSGGGVPRRVPARPVSVAGSGGRLGGRSGAAPVPAGIGTREDWARAGGL